MLPFFLNAVNDLAGIGTILFLALAVFSVLAFLMRSGKEASHFLAKHALLLTFILSAAGLLGSLFYSDIIGYPPCELCWWLRIFLYPQVIILLLAFRTRDVGVRSMVRLQSLVFSVFGFAVSFYQLMVVNGYVPLPACAATGVSCARNYVTVFGWVTIPIMALSSFLAVMTLWLHSYRSESIHRSAKK